MTINIENETAQLSDIPYERIIRDVVEESLACEGCPYETEVNVLLTDNDSIRQINSETRGIDSPTDVLSFPMIEYDSPADFTALKGRQYDCFNPESGELLLGDIVISMDKVSEQAGKYGHTRERELAFLTAHSMLHLFGYDHMSDDERIVMEKKQEEILNRRGYMR